MPHRILGVTPRVECSYPINKAYVVTDQDVKTLFEAGKSWVQNSTQASSAIHCQALLRNTEECLGSDDIGTILEYSNPKQAEIYSISIQMSSDELQRTFFLELNSHEHPDLVHLIIGGNDENRTTQCSEKLYADVTELTKWYSLLACRRWVIKLGIWIVWIFISLSVLHGLFYTFATIYRNYRTQKEYQQSLRKQPPSVSDASANKRKEKDQIPQAQPTQPTMNQPTSLMQLWRLISSKNFLLGIVFVLGGIASERFTSYLFPKAVFEIGKGRQRHERLKNIRKYVGALLVAIIVSGIIVPILNKLVTKFF
jgi:hypothetical protein